VAASVLAGVDLPLSVEFAEYFHDLLEYPKNKLLDPCDLSAIRAESIADFLEFLMSSSELL